MSRAQKRRMESNPDSSSEPSSPEEKTSSRKAARRAKPLKVYYCPACRGLFGHNYPKYTDDDTPPPTCRTCHPRATTTPITNATFASPPPATTVQAPPAVADDGEDRDDKRERLFLAAINSVTGETNAQVEAKKAIFQPALSSTEVGAKLRAAGVVSSSGSLKRLPQWSAEQLRDIVVWWRSRELVRCGRGGDSQLVSQLQDALQLESKLNRDMALHFT